MTKLSVALLIFAAVSALVTIRIFGRNELFELKLLMKPPLPLLLLYFFFFFFYFFFDIYTFSKHESLMI